MAERQFILYINVEEEDCAERIIKGIRKYINNGRLKWHSKSFGVVATQEGEFVDIDPHSDVIRFKYTSDAVVVNNFRDKISAVII